MFKPLSRVALPFVLAFALWIPLAQADIYTWVDSSGAVTLTNLPPPEGARVTSVMRPSPQAIAASRDAALNGARQADLQALSERVRQLEQDVEVATRTVPPPIAQGTGSPPPFVEYRVQPALQYGVEYAPQTAAACGPTSLDCASWALPAVYPVGVVVLRGASFAHSSRFHGRTRAPVKPPRVHPFAVVRSR